MNITRNLKDKLIVGVQSGSIALFLLLLSFSCTINTKHVELVRIFYLPEDLSVITPIDSCDKIFYHEDILADTIITDREFIIKFNNMVCSLKPAQEQNSNFDFRIRCVLKMKDGTKKVLCLGAYFDTVYEGKLFEDNPELFELIKKTVYKKYN